jgi:mRNA interferase HicA
MKLAPRRPGRPRDGSQLSPNRIHITALVSVANQWPSAADSSPTCVAYSSLREGHESHEMAGHGSVGRCWQLAITTVVLPTQHKCCIMSVGVTSQEFKRWLAKQGCTFESGHGGHLIVRLGMRMSVLPMHGKQKELGTGLVNRIKKDLGLK